jgi:molybdate transport system regulatory protein
VYSDGHKIKDRISIWNRKNIMPEKPARYKVRTKLWLHDQEGNVIFGMGRTKMLEAIEQCGSISAAAKELKMSYRAVWARIKATEERLGGQPLLICSKGGVSGGGATLTPFAKDLIKQYRALRKGVLSQSDRLYKKLCEPLIGE